MTITLICRRFIFYDFWHSLRLANTQILRDDDDDDDSGVGKTLFLLHAHTDDIKLPSKDSQHAKDMCPK